MIASQLSADERFGPVLTGCAGLRVPGAFDGFELTVRAILGQRVSVRAATTLAGRLAARFGESVETPFLGLDRLSPAAGRIAVARVPEIASLGITASEPPVSARSRKPSKMAISISILAPIPSRLRSPWRRFRESATGPRSTSPCVPCAWPDAFPAGDLVLLKASGEKSPQSLRERAEAWPPGGRTQPCIFGNRSTPF